MRIFSKSKPDGIDGRPMGFTGQDMKRPGGGIATREQQQQWMTALFDAFYQAHGSITLNELRVMLCIVEAHDRGRPMSPSDLGYHLDRRRKVLLATPRLLERRKKALTELTKVMVELWGWESLH